MLATATPLMQRILTTSAWPVVALLLKEPIKNFEVLPPEWFTEFQKKQAESPGSQNERNTEDISTKEVRHVSIVDDAELTLSSEASSALESDRCRCWQKQVNKKQLFG